MRPVSAEEVAVIVGIVEGALAAGLAGDRPEGWGQELAEAAGRRLVGQFCARRKPKIWRKPQGVGISISALSSCARQLAYELEEVPRDPSRGVISPPLRVRFALGDASEALMILALLAGGLEIEGSDLSEHGQRTVTAPIADRCWAEGHPDGVAWTLSAEGLAGDPLGLIEIKSAGPRQWAMWRDRAARGQPVLSEADGYWWQVQGYLRALVLPLALLIGVDRDSGCYGVWPIVADPARWEQGAAQHARAISSRLRSSPCQPGTFEPPGPGGRAVWYGCGSCAWAERCRRELHAAAPRPAGVEGSKVCSCGKQLLWIQTAKGKAAPVEVVEVLILPRKGGSVTGYTEGGVIVTGELAQAPGGGARRARLAHFSRCPDRDKHRRVT